MVRWGVFYPPTEVPQFITPAEAAREFRVTVRTVYAWLRAGKIAGVKIGGVWRVRREATK